MGRPRALSGKGDRLRKEWRLRKRRKAAVASTSTASSARLESRRRKQNQRCKGRRWANATDDDRATEVKRKREARRRLHFPPDEQFPFGVTCAVCDRLWFAGDVSTIGGGSGEKKRESGACALRQCIEYSSAEVQQNALQAGLNKLDRHATTFSQTVSPEKSQFLHVCNNAARKKRPLTPMPLRRGSTQLPMVAQTKIFKPLIHQSDSAKKWLQAARKTAASTTHLIRCISKRCGGAETEVAQRTYPLLSVLWGSTDTMVLHYNYYQQLSLLPSARIRPAPRHHE
ncbi:hypothetical protein HPB47_012346 [Ixodes persulcatus]|uniref:Uncharacterized protein n=1 Tax=Ixodes persulcatus TaxID=34615 RepID=A0AC60NTX3_IXOPE|nr:hypothetical protein HPB47_012346 [Ixodes persulcatus]